MFEPRSSDAPIIEVAVEDVCAEPDSSASVLSEAAQVVAAAAGGEFRGARRRCGTDAALHRAHQLSRGRCGARRICFRGPYRIRRSGTMAHGFVQPSTVVAAFEAFWLYPATAQVDTYDAATLASIGQRRRFVPVPALSMSCKRPCSSTPRSRAESDLRRRASTKPHRRALARCPIDGPAWAQLVVAQGAPAGHGQLVAPTAAGAQFSAAGDLPGTQAGVP